MSIAPSAHNTGMSSVRRNVTSTGMLLAARKQAPLRAAEAQARVLQQPLGDFGQAAFAGNTDAKVRHRNYKLRSYELRMESSGGQCGRLLSGNSAKRDICCYTISSRPLPASGLLIQARRPKPPRQFSFQLRQPDALNRHQHEQMVHQIAGLVENMSPPRVAGFGRRLKQLGRLLDQLDANFLDAPFKQLGRVRVRRRVGLAILDRGHELGEHMILLVHDRPRKSGSGRYTIDVRTQFINYSHFFMPTALDCWYLTGPTASGKTAVGVELARLIDAEIISLDSMAVYRGMDIGTAKPTAAERQRSRTT